MKISILYNFSKNPTGGGNQFLKALRNEFLRVGCYSSLEESEFVLFNSHHNFVEVSKARKKYTNKYFIHRIDGPIRLYNNINDSRDDIVYKMNMLANATVFQSHWSMKKNFDFCSVLKNKPFEIISNASEKIFERVYDSYNKIRLISTTVSKNRKKGFDIYQYLDNNLDFSMYEYTFVGNSCVKFKNIKHIKPVPTNELFNILMKHDIFITASINDPCSNSLIEALSCGLPVVARNSGGHPELLKDSGCLFNNQYDIMAAINSVSYNIDNYRKNIKVSKISDIAIKYVRFFESLRR